jgi:hypothetical protein
MLIRDLHRGRRVQGIPTYGMARQVVTKRVLNSCLMYKMFGLRSTPRLVIRGDWKCLCSVGIK